MRNRLSISPYLGSSSRSVWIKFKWGIASFVNKVEKLAIRVVIGILSVIPRHDKEEYLQRVEEFLITKLDAIHKQTLQQGTERFLLRPIEIVNAGWLVWISLAQTFGVYRTCDCVTSRWGHGGGYLDFAQQDETTADLIKYTWRIATGIASATMGIGMVYIVIEVMYTPGFE